MSYTTYFVTELLLHDTPNTDHKEKVIIEVVEQIGQVLVPSIVSLTNRSFITCTLN